MGRQASVKTKRAKGYAAWRSDVNKFQSDHPGMRFREAAKAMRNGVIDRGHIDDIPRGSTLKDMDRDENVDNPLVRAVRLSLELISIVSKNEAIGLIEELSKPR